MKTSIFRGNGVRDGTEQRATDNWAVEFAKRIMNKHRGKIPIDHPDGSVTREKLSDDVKSELETINGVKKTLDEHIDSVDKAILKLTQELSRIEEFIKRNVDDIFIREALYGIVNQFRDIYRSVGIVMYDGGYASMEYEGGAHLDGGAYGDNPSGVVVDGGDASQRAPVKVSVCSMDKIRGIFDD